MSFRKHIFARHFALKRSFAKTACDKDGIQYELGAVDEKAFLVQGV